MGFGGLGLGSDPNAAPVAARVALAGSATSLCHLPAWGPAGALWLIRDGLEQQEFLGVGFGMRPKPLGGQDPNAAPFAGRVALAGSATVPCHLPAREGASGTCGCCVAASGQGGTSGRGASTAPQPPPVGAAQSACRWGYLKLEPGGK